MREKFRHSSGSTAILSTQRNLLVGYICALGALSVSLMLMPTELLIWELGSGRIYGHSILFWLSLISVIFCFTRFKKENSYFKTAFPTRLPKKSPTLYRNRISKVLYLLSVCAFLLLLILFCFPFRSLPRFILFGICIFLLGLYLTLNSYAYHIYRKHSIYIKKSQTRRDENDENHQS